MRGSVGGASGREEAHCDEHQDCVDDVEELKCSGLVLHGCLRPHLALEADGKPDKTDDEYFLEADAAHIDVKT